MVAGHRDIKSEIKGIIDELELQSHMFSRDDLVKEAKDHEIDEETVDEAIYELIQDKYLHYVRGTDKLLSRTKWRDYSPAFEEGPEY